MPAVAYPSPGGMSFLQLTDLISGIAAKARIGGFAMVEFVPKKDLNGTAAFTAGRIAMHVLHHVAPARPRVSKLFQATRLGAHWTSLLRRARWPDCPAAQRVGG